MEPVSIIEDAIETVKLQSNYKTLIAYKAAVEVEDVDTLIKQGDPNVLDVILDLVGFERPKRIVDTDAKVFIESMIQYAVQDKRLYASYGPTGCGKTFSSTEISRSVAIPTAYLRLDQFNKRAATTLLIDIHQKFGMTPAGRNHANSRTLFARSYKNQILERFKNHRGLLIVDEAQKITDRNLETLRDLFDDSELSIVMLGSLALEDLLRRKDIDMTVPGQFIRRIDDHFDLPHASGHDVHVFLAAYGVNLQPAECDEIAKAISKWGDIDTLDRAMRAIAPVVDSKGLTWKHVGSARILTTIKRIIDGPRKEAGGTGRRS